MEKLLKSMEMYLEIFDKIGAEGHLCDDNLGVTSHIF